MPCRPPGTPRRCPISPLLSQRPKAGFLLRSTPACRYGNGGGPGREATPRARGQATSHRHTPLARSVSTMMVSSGRESSRAMALEGCKQGPCRRGTEDGRWDPDQELHSDERRALAHPRDASILDPPRGRGGGDIHAGRMPHRSSFAPSEKIANISRRRRITSSPHVASATSSQFPSPPARRVPCLTRSREICPFDDRTA